MCGMLQHAQLVHPIHIKQPAQYLLPHLVLKVGIGKGDLQNATLGWIIVAFHFVEQVVSAGKGHEIWWKISGIWRKQWVD